jgi:ubiquitin-activating enzyme E1 C
LFTEFKYLQDVLEIGGHILPFFVNEQKHNFPVCTTTTTHHMSVPSTMTLNTLLQQLCDREFCLKAPSVTSSVKTLYMRKPVALEKATRVNLDKPLRELISSGEELVVTDPVFPDTSLGLVMKFSDLS